MQGRVLYHIWSDDVILYKSLMTADPEATFICAYGSISKERMNSVTLEKSRFYIYHIVDDITDEIYEDMKSLGYMTYISNMTSNTYKRAAAYKPDMIECLSPYSADELLKDNSED